MYYIQKVFNSVLHLSNVILKPFKKHFQNLSQTKSVDEQKSYILRTLSNENSQSNTSIKFVKSSDNLISTSFDVAKSIAVSENPFGDSDFIKMSWLDCANTPFSRFC